MNKDLSKPEDDKLSVTSDRKGKRTMLQAFLAQITPDLITTMKRYIQNKKSFYTQFGFNPAKISLYEDTVALLKLKQHQQQIFVNRKKMDQLLDEISQISQMGWRQKSTWEQRLKKKLPKITPQIYQYHLKNDIHIAFTGNGKQLNISHLPPNLKQSYEQKQQKASKRSKSRKSNKEKVRVEENGRKQLKQSINSRKLSEVGSNKKLNRKSQISNIMKLLANQTDQEQSQAVGKQSQRESHIFPRSKSLHELLANDNDNQDSENNSKTQNLHKIINPTNKTPYIPQPIKKTSDVHNQFTEFLHSIDFDKQQQTAIIREVFQYNDDQLEEYFRSLEEYSYQPNPYLAQLKNPQRYLETVIGEFGMENIEHEVDEALYGKERWQKGLGELCDELDREALYELRQQYWRPMIYYFSDDQQLLDQYQDDPYRLGHLMWSDDQDLHLKQVVQNYQNHQQQLNQLIHIKTPKLLFKRIQFLGLKIDKQLEYLITGEVEI